MRDEYEQQPIGVDWTVGAATNTGDGIEAGLAVGAALALMDDAWWGPTIALPGQPYFCLAERTVPGGLMVNQAGVRFTNEAARTATWCTRCTGSTPTAPDIPAWLIVDQNYRDRYLFEETAAHAAAAGVVVHGRGGVPVGHDGRAGQRRSASRRPR